MEDDGKLIIMGYIGSSTTDNDWYYQSFLLILILSIFIYVQS